MCLYMYVQAARDFRKSLKAVGFDEAPHISREKNQLCVESLLKMAGFLKYRSKKSAGKTQRFP